MAATTKKDAPAALTADGDLVLHTRRVPFANYKVGDKDTVYNLWLRYRGQTTTGAIKAANGVETNELKPGKVIKIPLVLR